MSKLIKDSNGNQSKFIKIGDTGKAIVSDPGGASHGPLPAGVRLVKLVSDQPCYVLIGELPLIPTVNDFFLPAGVVEYVGAKEGDSIDSLGVSGNPSGFLFVTAAA